MVRSEQSDLKRTIASAPTFDHDDRVELIQKRGRVDGDDARRVLQEATGADDAIEETTRDVRVDSAQRIVERVEIAALIDGASERKLARLLNMSAYNIN